MAQNVQFIREIELTLLNRVRSLIFNSWPERVISLIPGKPVIFQLGNKIGVVSQNCVGDLNNQQEGLWGTLTEEEAIINGYPQLVPTASFIVLKPEEASPFVNLFIDQIFPVNSWVWVKEEDGRTYIVALKEAPSDKGFINKELKELITPIEGIWISKEKASQARIVEWIENDGRPLAILSLFSESDIQNLGKKKGDFLKVKIRKVVRDPVSRNCWVLAQTEEGFVIPIEPSEMSLSSLGYGLERIEGQTLNLTIKDFNKKGCPQLSNFDEIIKDLDALRGELSMKGKECDLKRKENLPGYIVEINKERENVVVVVPRKNGIVHSFVIYKDHVPGKRIENLHIGEEVSVNLLPKENEKVKVEIDLEEKEIVKLKRWFSEKGWNYDENEKVIFAPYYLKNSDFHDWPVSAEVANLLKRRSWQDCFHAKIVESIASKKTYEALRPNTSITGKIMEVVNYPDGSPFGLNIDIKFVTPQGEFQVIELLPWWEVSWKIKHDTPEDVVRKELKRLEGEIVTVRILKIDKSVLPPKLFLSRKRAFRAQASIIPEDKIGILIGRDGERIKNVIGYDDVNVDTRSVKGSIIVESPYQSVRDHICNRIRSEIQEISGWTYIEISEWNKQ